MRVTRTKAIHAILGGAVCLPGVEIGKVYARAHDDHDWTTQTGRNQNEHSVAI